MANTSTSYDPPMTMATLSELMAIQRESLAARPARPSALARLGRRVRALDLAPARRAVLVSLLSIAGFSSRHALVLGGCSAVVISAAIVAPALGWLAAAASLFFLEARRR
jgi:hypothetical protein